MIKISLIFLSLFISIPAQALEQAYPKTNVGVAEIKQLPQARVITANNTVQSTDAEKPVFKRLFNFLKVNDIAMTIPVEKTFDESEMLFYLGNDAANELQNVETVTLLNLPPRSVLSVGGKGSYKKENLQTTLNKAKQWLAQQSKWQADAEPYVVYWNSPFTLWFMKRFEVHVPVKLNNP